VLAVAAVPPSAPPDEIRRRADEVFRRPEFDTRGPSPTSWLARQLRDFFVWLGGLHANAPILFWVLLVGCLVALTALIVLIVFQVRSVFTAEGRRTDDRAARDARRLHLSENHRVEADRRAAAGDYTEAVRHLFLSLVYRFDERGRVSFQKAYTNREYLNLFRDRPQVRDFLRVFVDILDEHWYGQRPCERTQYESSLTVYERLAAAT
jgi:hypothetical protein